MADLVYKYTKVDNFDDAYANVEKYITPQNIQKFKVNAEIDYDKAGKKMVASGKGFTLNVNFFDDRVELHLKLSLILRPLRKTILGTMDREFSRLV